ncbi:MAG: hypothetical protein QM768_01685 [Agriterribacter sp.]
MKEETISEGIEGLLGDTGKYIEAKAELWKLKVADRTTEATTSIATQLILIFIAIMALTLINIAVAILIGKWLGELHYGFFIVAGFYILLGIIVYAFRKQIIQTPLYNVIINKILK